MPIAQSFSDEATEGLWRRILAAEEPIWCTLACRRDEVVGFAHYILHSHTWSLQPVCYLEDLLVVPNGRRKGIDDY